MMGNNFTTLRGIAAAFLLTVSLNGCSSGYELRAIVINGKIAFEPTKTDFWGDPDCIYSILVSAVNGPLASPTEGDGVRMVENGVYWNQAVTSCENPFPVIYGATLKGPPFREVDEYAVKAKPLRVGVVYEVSASSEGSAYGGGKFMITEDHKVRNLPL